MTAKKIRNRPGVAAATTAPTHHWLAVVCHPSKPTFPAAVIPVVEALPAKGAALGTVLAFMMSVIALSLPEMIILRKVLRIRLIAVFVGPITARKP